jgi:hypothetical protein
MNLTMVRVDISVRGAWEVALSDQRERVTCETLEEASRLAYRCAADRRPSELVVCDAYHRVVHRELINGREGRGRASSRANELVPSRRRPIRAGRVWAKTESALSDPHLASGSSPTHS